MPLERRNKVKTLRSARWNKIGRRPAYILNYFQMISVEHLWLKPTPSIFEEAFDKCFGEFFSPMQTIVPKQAISRLIELFKHELPCQFKAIDCQLNLAGRRTRHEGSPVMEIYDRKIFFKFCCDMRM
mmetsp:Transcript_21365/g.31775  ORF Transcript_21365/g.31775 Transcript_21365/m.31775 type:complete len:127 (-) Transcript_21365:2-382(-)